MDEQALRSIVEAVVEKVKPQNEITLKAALRLAEKVKAKAREMGVNAVVAISNRSARSILVECMDDSYIASYDIAVGKAFTVVSLKMSTSKLKTLAQPGGSLYGIQFTNDNKIVIFSRLTKQYLISPDIWTYAIPFKYFVFREEIPKAMTIPPI